MVLPRMRTLPVVLLALASACESAPLAGRTSAGSGAAVSVELLDVHFVLVDGIRQPWEDLVYRMRRECRVARVAEAAQGGAYEPPWILVRVADDVAPGAIPPDTLDRIIDRLREAGIRRIEIAQ